MATSGSFSTSSVGNFYFTFEWWRTGYDSNRNEHYIHYVIKTHNTPGSYRTVYDRNLYINGGLIYSDSGGVPMYDDEGLAEGDFTIGSYNSAGDGSFNAYFEAGVGISPGTNCSGSGDFGLDRIPRFASITNVPGSFNDESTFWFSYTNPANTSMSCWLEVNPNATHRAVRNLSGTGGTYTWSLTEDERNQLRADMINSNSGTIRVGLYSTIGGSTQASYIDRTFSIVNATPVFEDFTYQDINSTVTSVTGNNQVLVKGLSTLQVTIPSENKMTTKKQATPKNYIATIDALSASANYSNEDVSINVGTVTTKGTKRLTVRAYDSRNNSASVYKNVIVYDYEKPVINAMAKRANNFETSTTLSISGTFSLLTIDNVDKNTIQSVQYRYREKDGTWGNWISVTVTINNNTFTCNDVILTLDNTKEFDIEVKATDNLQDNTVALSIDIGKAIFFISSNQRKCYINNIEVLTKESEVEYSLEERVVGTWIDRKNDLSKSCTRNYGFFNYNNRSTIRN